MIKEKLELNLAILLDPPLNPEESTADKNSLYRSPCFGTWKVRNIENENTVCNLLYLYPCYIRKSKIMIDLIVASESIQVINI